MSGISALDPVATITAFRATSPAVARTTVDDNAALAVEPPAAPDQGDAVLLEPRQLARVVEVEITSSRRARTAGTSMGPIERPATRSTSRRSSTGRSSAFEGMQA